MVSPRLETIELTVQHVRDGGERMPVVSMHTGEGPLNAAERETIGNPWISVNVNVVVIIYELMIKRLAKGDPDDSRKENTDDAGDHTPILRARTATPSCADHRSFFPFRPRSHLEENQKEEIRL